MLDNTSSEIVLLRACMKGDTTAFETIVEKYQSLVCAITFSATANLDKSEELAQEAFIRAWINLAQLKDLTKFRAWLCSIARNIVRNYIRDKKRDVVGKAASIEKMAAGEITDVHQVMSTVEEANVAFNMMMEIRNKVMDAYQEVMRIRL